MFSFVAPKGWMVGQKFSILKLEEPVFAHVVEQRKQLINTAYRKKWGTADTRTTALVQGKP